MPAAAPTRKDGKRARGPTVRAGSSGENGNEKIRRSGRERSAVERYAPSSVIGSKKVRTRAPPRFHITPDNEWQWLVKKMNISVRNTLEWRRGHPLPEAPLPGACWLLPCKCDTAVEIGNHADALAARGWKLLTCPGDIVSRIGNKHNLFTFAKQLGLLQHLPQHYVSPSSAAYPCMLKAHAGEHGQGIYIVENASDVAIQSGSNRYNASKWLLQELCPGRIEHATSLLVKDGAIHDAICTNYEYDSESGIYVWPNVEELQDRRRTHEDIPAAHMEVMRKFVVGFSGICNFNYKIRPNGEMCIFEVNARIGADLACDVPRRRAAAFFNKLDTIGPSHLLGKVGRS